MALVNCYDIDELVDGRGEDYVLTSVTDDEAKWFKVELAVDEEVIDVVFTIDLTPVAMWTIVEVYI